MYFVHVIQEKHCYNQQANGFKREGVNIKLVQKTQARKNC
jgi:hypothetical protein